MSLPTSPARWASLRRRGLATIELACVLPMLLFILALIVDFGRLGYERCILASAAEFGASIARRSPPAANEDPARWNDAVQQAVEGQLAQLPGFSPALLQVGASQTTQAGVDCVQVEVRYPLRTWFAWPGFDHTLPLVEVAVRPTDL